MATPAAGQVRLALSAPYVEPGFPGPPCNPCARDRLPSRPAPSKSTNQHRRTEGTGDQSQEGPESQRQRRTERAGASVKVGQSGARGRETPASPDNPIEALILTRQPEIPAGLLNRVRCSDPGDTMGARRRNTETAPGLTRSC